MHRSIATISAPEFINLQPLDINPLMSKCDIKVMYLGANRNQSYIDKDVATEMAKTLRGAPIVGYYKESKEDFADHGREVVLDDEGIHFKCNTRPYGFVATDAKVWFQDFDDYDEFGHSVTRTYLMTTGFLWTGQYPECQCAVEGEGRPHSMEFHEPSVEGHWAEDYKDNTEFFIINDAIFSKLCILGLDVEPCFEGSSVTMPEISTTFTKVDDNFKMALKIMMQYCYTGTAHEGGQHTMDEKNIQGNPEQQFTAETDVKTEGANPTPVEDNGASFAKTDEEKKDEKNENTPAEDGGKKEDSSKPAEKEDEKKKPKSDCTAQTEEGATTAQDFKLLQTQYEDLQTKFSALQSEFEKLNAFKQAAEDEKKDALIAKFYMLSDEDKKDVIVNKAQYSLDEIESKLAVLYFRNNNFTVQNEEDTKSDIPATTFNLADAATATPSGAPAWMTAVLNNKKNTN